MSKIKYILFTYIFIVITIMKVDAASTCSSTMLYQEKQRASEIKVDFEVIDNVYDDEYDDECIESCIEKYLLVSLYNVPDEISVDVKSLNDTFKKFSLTSEQRNTNNELKIKDANATEIKRYEFKIKSASPDCYGEILKTLTLNTPMFNKFSDVASCEAYPDFKYCNKYVNFDISNLTNEKFNKIFDKYLEEKEQELEKENEGKESAKELFNKYWYIVVIIIIAIVLIVVLIKIIIKRREKKII